MPTVIVCDSVLILCHVALVRLRTTALVVIWRAYLPPRRRRIAPPERVASQGRRTSLRCMPCCNILLSCLLALLLPAYLTYYALYCICQSRTRATYLQVPIDPNCPTSPAREKTAATAALLRTPFRIGVYPWIGKCPRTSTRRLVVEPSIACFPAYPLPAEHPARHTQQPSLSQHHHCVF